MHYRALGKTGLAIAPLVFGGNVFGWTADEKTSFTLLDAFFDEGLNAIDTADVYSNWVEGNKGGESETIIGKWIAANPGKRHKMILITKVGSDMLKSGHKGLSEHWIEKAVDDSLRRLKTDVIDLYLSHKPDPETPHEETLDAYNRLFKAGKIRAVGCSNFDTAQLQSALEVANREHLPAYQVVEPEYNLYDRKTFDDTLRDLCVKEDIGVITYYSLASGFLSGKYRSQADTEGHPRGKDVAKYINDRGLAILKGLDTVAKYHNASDAEVALAWLIAQKGVTAPIASATRLDQLQSLVNATKLRLTPEDLALLDKASAL